MGTLRYGFERLRDTFGWDAVVPEMGASLELGSDATPSERRPTKRQAENAT